MTSPRQPDDSFLERSIAPPKRLEATLRAFADRLFVTGGRDPGDAALALPPARLELYRDLCRGNYRSMLRFAFTQSFALMEAVGQDTDAFIARFLEVSPSRTHSSREIADRFLVFLPRTYPELVERRADLLDLMRIERAELATLFAPDDPGRCLEPAEVDAVAAGSLDALLAMTLVRAPSASSLRLAHAVVELRAALERGEPAPPVRAVPERATVGRGGPPRFRLDFATHDEAAFLVLATAAPGVAQTGEHLAATWFGALSGDAAAQSDAWKAAAFATAVVTGLRTGFFRAN